MLETRYQQLTLLGLGSSIGTPPEGITAEVIVFKDFSEMPARASDVSLRFTPSCFSDNKMTHFFTADCR